MAFSPEKIVHYWPVGVVFVVAGALFLVVRNSLGIHSAINHQLDEDPTVD